MSGTIIVVLLLLLIFLGVLHWRDQRQQKQIQREADSIRQRGVEFVANVSHELKTPLTSIVGFAETVKGMLDKDPVKAKEFVGRIEDNAHRLLNLVKDILELSRIEQPNFYLHRERIELPGFLAELERRFKDECSAKNQTLVVTCSARELKADPWLLDQALTNLIENAHTHCPEGTRIEVGCRMLEDGSRNSVEFVINDNGPGISPENQSRIFERFYRVEKSRTREHGGTGLGLAIVKHILFSHGGAVQLKSEVGKGARFSLIFPNDS